MYIYNEMSTSSIKKKSSQRNPILPPSCKDPICPQTFYPVAPTLNRSSSQVQFFFFSEINSQYIMLSTPGMIMVLQVKVFSSMILRISRHLLCIDGDIYRTQVLHALCCLWGNLVRGPLLSLSISTLKHCASLVLTFNAGKGFEVSIFITSPCVPLPMSVIREHF